MNAEASAPTADGLRAKVGTREYVSQTDALGVKKWVAKPRFTKVPSAEYIGKIAGMKAGDRVEDEKTGDIYTYSPTKGWSKGAAGPKVFELVKDMQLDAASPDGTEAIAEGRKYRKENGAWTRIATDRETGSSADVKEIAKLNGKNGDAFTALSARKKFTKFGDKLAEKEIATIFESEESLLLDKPVEADMKAKVGARKYKSVLAADGVSYKWEAEPQFSRVASAELIGKLAGMKAGDKVLAEKEGDIYTYSPTKGWTKGAEAPTAYLSKTAMDADIEVADGKEATAEGRKYRKENGAFARVKTEREVASYANAQELAKASGKEGDAYKAADTGKAYAIRGAKLVEKADFEIFASDIDLKAATRSRGTFAKDGKSGDVYVNTDGATGWTRLGVTPVAAPGKSFASIGTYSGYVYLDKTAGETASTMLVDASAGAATIVLPAPASSAGRILTIKKIDTSANAVVLDAKTSSTQIDGNLTMSITNPNGSYKIHCDGKAWYVIGCCGN